MKKTILLVILLTSIFLPYTANAFTVGYGGYTTSWETLSECKYSLAYEYQLGIPVSFYSDGYIDYIKAYLKRGTTQNTAKCGIYCIDDNVFIGETNEQTISSSTGAYYTFTFPSNIVIDGTKGYEIIVYGNANTPFDMTWIYCSYSSITGLNSWKRTNNTYGTFQNSLSGGVVQNNKQYSITANFTHTQTVNLYDDLTNITTTDYEYNLNDYDVNVWFNGTGNTTPIHLLGNRNYCYGTYIYTLLSTGYNVYANYSSGITVSNPVDPKGNPGNVTGFSYYLWNYSLGTGWYVFLNYTSYIHQFNNVVNATFTHENNYVYGANGTWNDWINATGNSSCNYTIPDMNTSNIWLYTGDVITLEPFVILLMYLLTLLYFVFSSKTNSMFISTGSHYIFMFSTIILLFGIEVGEFVTDLGLTELQRAILFPFLLVFIALLWLMKPVKK